MNKFEKAIAAIKGIKNTLSGDAEELAGSMIDAIEALRADSEEHNRTELNDRIAQLQAEAEQKAAEAEERTADKILKLKNELTALVGGSQTDEKQKITRAVANAVCKVMTTAHSKDEAVREIRNIAAGAGIKLRTKKDDIEGLQFAEFVDYSIQYKQEDNDEIYDALYKTNRTKIFAAEIDPNEANQIAHGWPGFTSEDVKKAVQEINVEGKTINRKLVYKIQRIANEDIIRAEETGEWAAIQRDVQTELRRGVKGVQVRAIMIGDTVNANGSKVDTFETIGTKTRTDLFTTVLAPSTPNVVTLVDVARAVSKVRGNRKWVIMSPELKLALRQHLYGAGGTVTLISDADLAAMVGADRIFERDFMDEVDGLHAIVFVPDEYWVNNGGEINATYPVYDNNVQKIMHEQYVGGIIRGIKSTAVLSEAAESSSSSSAGA